jgi:hypothetical protein
VKNDDSDSKKEGEVIVAEIKEGEDEEQAMMRLMGFSGFNTSHGKKVETNHKGAQKGGAKTKSKRKYRQFMNRKFGGRIAGD